MAKNKISNAAYCIKRLRDNGFVVNRIFSTYDIADPRLWTAMINPGKESIYLTHFSNQSSFGESFFEFNDGGIAFPRNFKLKTESVEVLVTYLIEKGVENHAWTKKERRK